MRTTNKSKTVGKRLCAVMAAMAVLLGAACSLDGSITPVIKAQAAQTMQVSELSIVPLPGGISAKCVYQELDSTVYAVQLYMEKMDETGSFAPVAYKDLPSSGNGQTTLETTPLEVESGVYRAVLLMRSSTGQTMVRFRDSGLYDVTKTGGQYVVGPHQQPEDMQPESEQAGDDEGADDSGMEPCLHSPVCSIYKEATPQSDAVLKVHCEKCGQHMPYQEVPNSAYASFLEETAERIKDAGQGEQVVISTDRWISFDKRVLAQLAEREDISVLIAYRYEGSDFAVLIPAGTDVNGLADENGYCGFRYLASLFGDAQGKIDG